jgi:hypothetical protein
LQKHREQTGIALRKTGADSAVPPNSLESRGLGCSGREAERFLAASFRFPLVAAAFGDGTPRSAAMAKRSTFYSVVKELVQQAVGPWGRGRIHPRRADLQPAQAGYHGTDPRLLQQNGRGEGRSQDSAVTLLS